MQKKTGKQSKSTKNNFEQKAYASAIFAVVFITMYLCFVGLSLVNFLIASLLTLIILAAFFLLSSGKNNSRTARHKKEIAKKSSTGQDTELKSFHPKTRNAKLIKLEKKNFNWSGKDVIRGNLEAVENVNTISKGYNDEEYEPEKKPIKMVPYRSPFDPINPPKNAQDAACTTIIKTEQVGCQGNDKDEKCHLMIEPWDKGFIGTDECSQSPDGTFSPVPVSIFESIQNEAETAAVSESQLNLGVDYTTHEGFIHDYEAEFDKDTMDIENESKVVRLPILMKASNLQVPAKQSVMINKNREKTGLPHIKPSIDLLKGAVNEENMLCEEEEYETIHDATAKKLIETLASFGVGAKILEVSQGPSVTRYELQPNAGIKVSKIVGLADDIALNLAATGVRIEAPIPGKAAIGIEVPNKEVQPVFIRDVIETEEFLNHPSKLAFAVGKDVSGRTVVGDIAKMPHLLVAGATGSGKSVCINTLIASILFKATPQEVKLLMVDPKVVELGIYNGIPHLLIPVVTDPKKAAGALNWAVVEMTNRYKLFADNNVRDLKGFNALMKERGEGTTLPQIVIIIDELADLMMVAPNDVEDCICRLAQMARAAGMHLVIATQRPSVDVITGVIKANIPSRISFAVSSQIDSRTILDMAGAEKLLGRGDMLFNPIGEPKPVRVQGAFISDKEVEAIVNHLKANSLAEYDEEILAKINSQNEQQHQPDTGGDDELLMQAIDMVLEVGQASTSLIQRRFKVGYSRAGRIMDQMEAWGVVGPPEGSKPRQILITKQEWEELKS